MLKTSFPVARYFSLLILSMALFSCYQHTMPDADKFIADHSERAQSVQVFVDCNGTFYPSDWKKDVPRNGLRGGVGSLLNYSKTEKKRQFSYAIEKDETRQLQDLAAFVADKKRVFVFVHGYNNTAKSALADYQKLETKLNLAKTDGVIRFYWDGLNGALLGGAPIWFNATGYSQPAGSRGLRRVLDQISEKDVYLLCHSRGTSVVLSALSNPGYDKGFEKATQRVVDSWGTSYDGEKYDGQEFLFPAPLETNANRLHVIAMAPAVDRIDFTSVTDRRSYRPLGGQLKSFRYSVNKRDLTLNKFVGLGGHLNPTGFGYKDSVGAEIERHYGKTFRSYKLIPGSMRHGWSSYMETPVFKQMLEDAGLAR